MKNDELFNGFLIGVGYSALLVTIFIKFKDKIDNAIDYCTIKFIKKFIKKR